MSKLILRKQSKLSVLHEMFEFKTIQWHIQGGAQGAGAPPKPQRYINELLRYISLYQQVLSQTIIWRQKR